MYILLIISRAMQNAYRSISSVKWKSAIAATTIFMGTLAITTTFTISGNIDGYVEQMINQNGGAKVSLNNVSTNVHFNQDDLKKFKGVSVVERVYFTDESYLSFRFGDKSAMLKTVAVSSDNLRYLPIKLKAGKNLTLLDIKYSSQSVVVSSEVVKKLEIFGPIGKFLNIRLKGGDEVPLKIIGIVDPQDNSYAGGAILVSFDLYREITGKKSMSLMHVVASGADWMNWVESFGQSITREKFGSNVWITNPLDQFIEQKNRLTVFIRMGYILGFLALIAGSIGTTSVMLLNVNLRKKEIGLYKSMGFSSPIILLQFLLEAFIISLIGGVFGSLFGSLLGLKVSSDMFPFSKISLEGIGFGLLTALVTGVVFGLIPAVLASRTDPVKALQ